MALRVSLKHEVSKQPFDELHHGEGGRREALEDDRQHPGPGAEGFEAVVDPQIAVLLSSRPAPSVDDDKAKSAQVLRHLDLDRFRSLLKRDYIQGPGGNLDTLLDAQTELDKVQKKRRQDEGTEQHQLLSPTPDAVLVWSDKLRQAIAPLQVMDATELDMIAKPSSCSTRASPPSPRPCSRRCLRVRRLREMEQISGATGAFGSAAFKMLRCATS